MIQVIHYVNLTLHHNRTHPLSKSRKGRFSSPLMGKLAFTKSLKLISIWSHAGILTHERH